MSFFVKAAIDALKAFPAVNAEMRGNDIVYKNHYDIGVAVGGGKGLVVPVVRDAERLSLRRDRAGDRRAARRARKDNKLTLKELEGGTFTISNGGVYGSMLSTPILNPPQSGILGLHAIQKRPVVVDDQIVIRPMMYVALSYDHRLVDGREAVQFLVRMKECVEDPRSHPARGLIDGRRMLSPSPVQASGAEELRLDHRSNRPGSHRRRSCPSSSRRAKSVSGGTGPTGASGMSDISVGSAPQSSSTGDLPGSSTSAPAVPLGSGGKTGLSVGLRSTVGGSRTAACWLGWFPKAGCAGAVERRRRRLGGRLGCRRRLGGRLGCRRRLSQQNGQHQRGQHKRNLHTHPVGAKRDRATPCFDLDAPTGCQCVSRNSALRSFPAHAAREGVAWLFFGH